MKKVARFTAFQTTFHLLLVGLVLSLSFGIFTVWRATPECANSISCIKELDGRFQEGEYEGEFLGQVVSFPQTLAITQPESIVLGATDQSNKHIYIDLSAQRLFAKEGDRTIHEFPISSGKWGRTPTGTFHIWIKLRYTKMEGGSKALNTYYYLPNVPYTMYFYNDEIPKWRGFGIHGAYWHNNFGHPMSHGCINMRPEDAGILYEWAMPIATGHTTFATSENPSTPITIYGVAPHE